MNDAADAEEASRAWFRSLDAAAELESPLAGRDSRRAAAGRDGDRGRRDVLEAELTLLTSVVAFECRGLPSLSK